MTHRIVIVGGGAGGLEPATQLGQQLGRKGRAHITLVGANLTYIWKPLLHEVAAGSLNSSLDELNYVAQARWNHFHFQYGRMATNRINQIEVLPTLQSVSDESIFSLGDCAACPIQGNDGKRVPPRAQAAHQQAKLLAKNLQLRLTGKPLRKCVYRDYGTLVSLPSLSALGTLMGKLSGTTFVEGLLARMFYLSLYRMHQAALLGKRRVILKMVGDLFTKQTRPRLRLHRGRSTADESEDTFGAYASRVPAL